MNNSQLVTPILPIHNEADYIGHCLRAILVQDYPGEMETLVVDGMSTDTTRDIIQDLTRPQSAFILKLLDNPSKIVPTGMNLALRQAKVEIIIRVDGHCIIAPDYVHQCVDTLQRTNAENVSGKMNAIGSNSFGKAVALATPINIGCVCLHSSDVI